MRDQATTKRAGWQRPPITKNQKTPGRGSRHRGRERQSGCRPNTHITTTRPGLYAKRKPVTPGPTGWLASKVLGADGL